MPDDSTPAPSLPADASSPAPNAAPPPPRGRLGRGLADLGQRLEPLQRGWRWAPLAIAAGVLPLLACWPLGTSAHQGISGIALTLVVWACALRGRTAAGLGAIAVAYLAHSACAIALSAAAPVEAAALFPDGADYWVKQEAWIRTGHDPEYDPASWLPIHLQLLVACLVLAPLTLGLAIFARGFYEVDLMNYYVGQLWRESAGAAGSLAVGWHPWSLCRGLCYVLLTYELVSVVCERLAGRSPPPVRARATRLAVACGFFVADCVIKSLCTEQVRGVLHASLVR